jgi:O-antigen/teichoic acid export membrane protein
LPKLGAGLSTAEVPFGRLARYGFAVYLSGIAYLVSQQLDQLLLSMSVAPAELGYYATAASISGLLLVIPSALGPVAFSKIARSNHSPGEQRLHVRESLTLGICFIVPAGLILTALAPWVVRIVYGQAFARSGRVLLVLAPAAIFLGIALLMADVLRGAGKPMAATHATIVAAIFTAVGLAYALPRYGVFGAAWVSFGAYLLMAVIQGWGIWTWARRA